MTTDRKYMRLDVDNVKATLSVEYCGIVLDTVNLVIDLGIGFVRLYDLYQSTRDQAPISFKNDARSINLFLQIIKNSTDVDTYGQIKFFRDDLIIDLSDDAKALPLGKDRHTGTIVTNDIIKILEQVKR